MKFFLIFLLILSSSCSFFNHKVVELGVDSSPRGASIYVNDQYYGETPQVISIPPKETFVILDKKGYGSTSFKAPIFLGSIRTKANGRMNADGFRCLLDLSSVIFFFQAYTGNCADFKEKQYRITIPKNGYSENLEHLQQKNYEDLLGGGFGNSNSLVGTSRDPQNVINYYYNQDQNDGTHQIKYQNPYQNLDYQKIR